MRLNRITIFLTSLILQENRSISAELSYDISVFTDEFNIY